MQSVCVAILNYNGIRHLEHLLPSLREACERSPIPASVVVLDNQSTGGDEDWIQRHHPEARCIVAPKNDFFYSYNWLLAELDEDVVILLNNDIRVRSDFIGPLLRHLESADVFAASASCLDWDGSAISSGPAELRHKNGFYSWPYNIRRQETSHTFFCSGACMAVDRKKFLELGGFSPLFYPAYCEDLEICFRAWRRGWRCVYEPASVVWHRESASWTAVKKSKPERLTLRNSFLFQWAFLPMRKERVSRYWSTLKILAGSTLKGDFHWLRALFEANVMWMKNRRRYRGFKVSSEQLDALMVSIGLPVEKAGGSRDRRPI